MNTFFEESLIDKLLSALFMGEEESAEKIVLEDPDLLFEKGTYKMPLLKQDGTCSDESEQVYRDTTPLQLMLYTGDWKIWDRIFPLIPKERLGETLQEMHKIARGGPDLVKIDRDPTQLSVDELRRYYEKEANGQLKIDVREKPIVYDLLCNPDGIFYVESNNPVQFYQVAINSQTQEKTITQVESNNPVQFYQVAINPETQERTITQLAVPTNMTAEDEVAFKQFRADIRDNMPMNSSRRSSDDEHALIARIFGIKLERNGIHYELNGKQYQDTYDGSIRIKNAYRRYFEIYNAYQEGTPEDAINAAWCDFVGMAQRHSMVHVIQRFFEKDKLFHPGRNKNDLRSHSFIRTTDGFNNWITDTKKMYPLRAKADLGFNFGLYKKRMGFFRPYTWPLEASATAWNISNLEVDLEMIRLFEEVRAECFDKRLYEIDQSLHPSSDQFFSSGCFVV